MAITPIRGFDGTVNQGVTPTALLAITDWQADIELEIATVGPYLNDQGLKYKIRGGKDITGTVNGAVPAGKDTSQTAVINALINGTDLNLVLKQGDTAPYGGGASNLAYTVTVPTAVISNVSLGQDSSDGTSFSFDFEGNGSFTVS